MYIQLAAIAQINSGIAVSKSRVINEPIDVPYLRVANVQRGKINLDEVKTISIEKHDLQRFELCYGDILFNEGGDRDKLGRGWIWESQIVPCITQNHVFRATTFIKNISHSKYISFWGNTFGQNYFERTGKQTTNLASINKTVLSLFPIPMCSIAEQEEIDRVLEAQLSTLDKLDLEINLSLTKADVLRQSILKQAFSGQLVPQDPNDEPASVLLERIAKEKATSAKKGKPRQIKKEKSKHEHRSNSQQSLEFV